MISTVWRRASRSPLCVIAEFSQLASTLPRDGDSNRDPRGARFARPSLRSGGEAEARARRARLPRACIWKVFRRRGSRPRKRTKPERLPLPSLLRAPEERRKFGPIGWNIPYEWMDSDFNVSREQVGRTRVGLCDEAWLTDDCKL